MKKSFAQFIAPWAFVAFLLLAVGYATCHAQTPQAEKQAKKPEAWDDVYLKYRWSNERFFKYPEHQPKKFLDWGSYDITWDVKQVTIWAGLFVSGMAHGAREAYHADPRIFEKNFGAQPLSWWGSEAWKLNYVDNDPQKPHKHELLGNVGRDFWHTANMVDFIPLTLCITLQSTRKQPVKYRVLNGLIGIGARTLGSMLTYNTLRLK